MNAQDLINELTKEGYKEIREVPGIGLCGLKSFIFTVGLCCGLDEFGYKYRYCYSVNDSIHAVIDIKTWKGNGDPSGPWIKRKGEGGDYLNPNKN